MDIAKRSKASSAALPLPMIQAMADVATDSVACTIARG